MEQHAGCFLELYAVVEGNLIFCQKSIYVKRVVFIKVVTAKKSASCRQIGIILG